MEASKSLLLEDTKGNSTIQAYQVQLLRTTTHQFTIVQSLAKDTTLGVELKSSLINQTQNLKESQRSHLHKKVMARADQSHPTCTRENNLKALQGVEPPPLKEAIELSKKNRKEMKHPDKRVRKK
jgi:hypothetical protein